MKKLAIALAAAAAFIGGPAHATYFYWDGDRCGPNECTGPLIGKPNTYNGKGGDINNWSTFSSTINIATSILIGDVNVALNDLDHSSINDLKITLTHGSTTVTLLNRPGSSSWSTSVDGDYLFDQDTSNGTTGSSNYKPGTYKALGTGLDAFDGLDAKGNWTLTIYDKDNIWKDGELCDWTLQITPDNTAGGVPEPATWAMMIAGFGLVGYQLRRRRSDTLATVGA